MRRKSVYVAATFIVLATIAFWSLRPVPVQTATAGYGSAALLVYASGQVMPDEKINLRSKTIARIVQFHVEEGQPIKKGDLLVSLESDEASAQLKAARAELDQIASDTDYKRREYERIQKLFQQQAVSLREHDNALSILRSAENLLNRARANLQAFQARNADLFLNSPFDGLVLEKLLDKGATVSNTDNILALATAESMTIEGKVDELDADRVRIGQKVLFTLDSLPGRTYEGTIRTLAPRIDYTTKSFKIKVDLPANIPVRPGMSAELNILVKENQNALLIPVNSLIDGSSVWIVKDNKSYKKSVKTGLRDSRKVEILEGLNAGDTVILTPVNLKEGTRVKSTATNENRKE